MVPWSIIIGMQLLKGKEHLVFGFFMAILYAVSIWFSYQRIYVHEDYPIFYSEEELPDPLDSIKHFLKIDSL
jgi:hypothetical protein